MILVHVVLLSLTVTFFVIVGFNIGGGVTTEENEFCHNLICGFGCLMMFYCLCLGPIWNISELARLLSEK